MTELGRFISRQIADGRYAFAQLTKTGAPTKRPLAAHLGVNYTPEDFGAIGDGSSHLLSASYGVLAAAQVDYPAATALSDEKDWCAWKYMLETSGAINIVASGKYQINNVDLTHALRFSTGQRITFTTGAQLIYQQHWYPVLVAREISDLRVDGLTLVATGTVTDPTTCPVTRTAYNSTIGSIYSVGPDREFNHVLGIMGSDRCVFRGLRHYAQSPGIFKSAPFVVKTHPHTTGKPIWGVEFHDSELDDYCFGFLISSGNGIKIKGVRSERYDQYYSGNIQPGHLIYMTNCDNSVNLYAEITGIRDQGYYIGSDSYPMTVDTTADTVICNTSLQPLIAAMANGQGVMFLNDLPPSPLVQDKTYYVANYNSTTGAFQVSNTYGGTAIDLTAQPGANCRVGFSDACYTMNVRWMRQGQVTDIKSQRPHGLASMHSLEDVQIVGWTYDVRIYTGSVVSGVSNGATLDAGIPDRDGATQGKWIRITAGTGAGQKRKIVLQKTGRFCILDSNWTTVPDATSTYAVGNFYACSTAAINMPTPASNQLSIDRVSGSDIKLTGEFAGQPAVNAEAGASGGAPAIRALDLRGLNIDRDVSRDTTFFVGIISLHTQESYIEGKVTHRGNFPSGERGTVNFLGGCTSTTVDLLIEDPATYSRVVGSSGNADCLALIRTRTNRPIPYGLIQFINMGGTDGFSVQSGPNEAVYASSFLGNATASGGTQSTTGRLPGYGLYEVWIEWRDSGQTNVSVARWRVKVSSVAAAQYAIKLTEDTVGTALTGTPPTLTLGAPGGATDRQVTITATNGSASTLGLTALVGWRRLLGN